jgi:hypothetical protein
MMEKHDPKRRTILLGTFAAGAALVLPGCQREQEGKVSGGSEPGAESAADKMRLEKERAMNDAPPPKMSKEGAQYQEEPLGEQKCANCTNFIADSKTCKVVEGEVSPKGWCILWTAA